MLRQTAWACLLLLLAPLAGALAADGATAPAPPHRPPAREQSLDNLHGAEKLTALIRNVSQVQAATKTLVADFEQRKVSHLLAAPSVSQGRFYFEAPDKVRWEYTAPRPMTVLLSGGVAITYRPLEKRAERIEVGRVQRKVFRFLGASEPLEELERYFAFTFIDRGPGHDYTLSLKPTAHVIKKRIREVEVDIDRETFLPVAVSYSETDGDSTAYAFHAIVRNKPLDAGLFRLELPPDVQVVEMKLHAGE